MTEKKLLRPVSRPALTLSNSGATFRQFLHDFFWVSKQIELGREEFAKVAGLNTAQYSMLMLVAQASKDGLSPSEVAERLHLHGPYAVLHLGNLAKKGLLIRNSHPSDGRSVLYVLSPKGAELVEFLTPIVQTANDGVFESLSREDMLTLAKIFDNLSRDSEIAVQGLQLRVAQMGELPVKLGSVRKRKP